MTTLVWVLLVLLALAGRSMCVRRALARRERLWRLASGPLTMELRRQTLMCRLGDLGDDLQAFPQPRECRVLALRLAGIPLWSQWAIVSLPSAVDARIGSVAADEFDHLFAPPFRRQPGGPVVRTLFAAQH